MHTHLRRGACSGPCPSRAGCAGPGKHTGHQTRQKTHLQDSPTRNRQPITKTSHQHCMHGTLRREHEHGEVFHTLGFGGITDISRSHHCAAADATDDTPRSPRTPGEHRGRHPRKDMLVQAHTHTHTDTQTHRNKNTRTDMQTQCNSWITKAPTQKGKNPGPCLLSW